MIPSIVELGENIMKFVLFILISVFTLSVVNACDIRFTIQNETQENIKINSSGLTRYAVSKSVPEEIYQGKEAEAVISVKPEMFDINKKEKISLLINDNPITDIFIEFPKGSVLLSAVAHDISNGTVSSRLVYVNDQMCGKSTKWKNVIRIRQKSN